MLRQLSRLLIRQASHDVISHCGPQQVASSTTAVASTSTCSTSSLAQRFRPSRMFSTTPHGESKSMLGSGGTIGHTAVLESAAEARMHKIKSRMNIPEPPEQKHPIRRALGYIGNVVLTGLAGAGLAATYYYVAYDIKELKTMVEETKSKEENAFLGSEHWVKAMEKYLSVRESMEEQIKAYTDPTYHKLLPDMAPELRGRIKTLVLDLDDVLVHKEWTRQRGWTIFKRPGVQDFLFEMGQYFEVVVFTDEPNTYADPIINRLDVHRVIPYRLYRPETQYVNGKHVRDLSKLNRDLSQVLFISADPDAYSFQPENTIKLQRWANKVEDTTLLDLIPMLQMIATKGIRDVRDVVRSYDGEEDIPKAFKARMQNVAGQQKQSKPRGFLTLGK